MLASAWAPRGPFLWAVLPPVGLWILERVVVGSEYVGDFITDRLFGLYRLLGDRGDDAIAAGQAASRRGRRAEQRGPVGSLREFYACAGAVARPGGGGAAAGGRDLGAPLPRRDELNPEIGRSLTMKTIFRATAALALLTATLPALAASATATRSWQYKPESNAGLTVRNLMGNVRVERGTAPGIHVTANTTIETASQAEADALIKLVDFRTSDVGAGSRFDVRLPRQHFPKLYWDKGASTWFSLSYVEYLGERIRLVGDRDDAPLVRVDLVIRAPAGAKLEVDNTFGDAIAQGYSGYAAPRRRQRPAVLNRRRGRGRARQRQRRRRRQRPARAGRGGHRQRRRQDHRLRVRDRGRHRLRVGRRRAAARAASRPIPARATSMSRILPVRSPPTPAPAR